MGKDFARIREYNPLGRVPTLVLEKGESLIESAAILDHLDELAGPERALLPVSGADRRQALNLMALATGAAEKGLQQNFERIFRPEEKRHEPWVERCRLQMGASLSALDRYLGERGVSQWLVGSRMTQADITAVCVFTFLNDTLRVAKDPAMYPVAGHAGGAMRGDAGVPGNARAVHGAEELNFARARRHFAVARSARRGAARTR